MVHNPQPPQWYHTLPHCHNTTIVVHNGTQWYTAVHNSQPPQWYAQPREEAGGRWTVIHFLPTWEICSKLNNSGCGFGRRSSKTVNIVKRIFPLKSSKFCPRRWLDIIDWVPRNVQQHIVTKSLENEKNGSERYTSPKIRSKCVEEISETFVPATQAEGVGCRC